MTGFGNKNFELRDNDFNYIRKLVYDECGINLHEGKKELVRSRLAKRLRDLNISEFRVYKSMLEDSGEELINLLNAVSTNLTSFFREKKHFDFLEKRGLSQIVKNLDNNKTINAWSAGCSTGEEPYTIAMVIDSWIESMPGYDFRITATDISTDVLLKADAGIYDILKTAGIDQQTLRKYFQKGTGKRKGYVRIQKKLRKKIDFMRFNLMQPYTYDTSFDFIFCRNVMIYFEKKIQATVINKFYDILKPGGFLFVGHSESLMNINHKFKYVEPTIYQK
ncbi:MAG: CheR family methyltransferase [Thermodesulfobacteriota bacterium]